MKNVIYVVTAHRTTRSQHSYVVGLYENLEDAEKSAEIEEHNRGGKYAMLIKSFFLNKIPEKITDNEL
jgi:predicted transcriptional regulator